ncbi:hypothetical protein GCM10009718_27790 [Isoptericola halotolerans]
MVRTTYALTPTIWGYARISGSGTPERPGAQAGVVRVDVMVPPLLTPDELADLHARLRPTAAEGGREVDVGLRARRVVREALAGAIEVQTSEALDRADRDVAESPLVGAFARLVVRGGQCSLAVAHAALARELAWAGVRAACEGDTSGMVDAVLALDALLAAPNRT